MRNQRSTGKSALPTVAREKVSLDNIDTVGFYGIKLPLAESLRRRTKCLNSDQTNKISSDKSHRGKEKPQNGSSRAAEQRVPGDGDRRTRASASLSGADDELTLPLGTRASRSLLKGATPRFCPRGQRGSSVDRHLQTQHEGRDPVSPQVPQLLLPGGNGLGQRAVSLSAVPGRPSLGSRVLRLKPLRSKPSFSWWPGGRPQM